jgi:hypothetical protein
MNKVNEATNKVNSSFELISHHNAVAETIEYNVKAGNRIAFNFATNILL